MKPIDPLNALLRRAMSLQKQKQKQEILEKEASERVTKLQRLEEFASAFDAERFRFLVTSRPEFSGRELNSIRKQIDLEIEQSIIRDLSAAKRRIA